MMKLHILLVAIILSACQKEEASTPRFVYKENSSAEEVAKIGDKTIKASDAFGDIKDEIYNKEMELYDLKMGKIKAVMLEHFMSSHPGKKNLTNDQFLEKFIMKGKGPSQKQINDFIKERKIPQDQIDENMRKRINAYLSMEQKKKAVDKWLNQQTQKSSVEIYLKKPSRPQFNVPVTDEDPSWGNKDAKVTIVEYSDFQCPFCAKGADRLKEIKKIYGKNKVKVVFKHFPLPFHKNAKDAAMASMCAHEQGADKFWKVHDHMFANQDKLDMESLKGLASKFGLNKQKYETCLSSGKYKAKIESDQQAGRSIYVKSTPTFFINGKLLSGARPIEDFKEEIDQYL